MDVEQYFNYMGMLATEGSYDTLNKYLESGKNTKYTLHVNVYIC